MTYQENFQKWADFADLPDYLRRDLENMDEKTKEDAFYTNLEFGTAGMRGLIGAGTNRINIYVVRQATEGLARLIESKGGNEKERGVAIAYDSRHFSPEFAFESAAVLAKHGIKSYVFESLRPTPELSFAVRHLNCFAGIMITASHNPAPFNGYKVYGEDGGQMPPHDADALTTYIRAIDNLFAVEVADVEAEKAAGLIEVIGEEFIRIFEEEAKKIGAVEFLAQGTIYPDVVESGLGGESAVIKSHHNVGGLPEYVDFKEIIEPLRDLFKDEVRKAGLELGLPEKLVFRQPFPGPGLGIRIIGEVTAEKVRIVQDADAIYREEIANAGLDRSIGQYFAALTNMRSVGVMGDERTYDYAVALRAVNTVDFMTAEAAEIPFAVLQSVMSRIINEVRGVNRVFYDLTSKPPGTIEFE
mgnify:CR=1 FL=1